MKAKKIILSVWACFILLSINSGYAKAAEKDGCGETAGQYDIVLTLLMPAVNDAAQKFYEPYLTVAPTVAAYFGSEILGIREGGERVHGGNYYPRYTVTVEVFPYVGPHLSVGKDRIIFNVLPLGAVEVREFQHLESHELTSNYASIIKKPLP